MQPVYRQFLEHARRTPEKPAVIAGGVTLTYGELSEKVQATAATLARGHGIGANDRVLLTAGADADFVSTYLALHTLGAVAAPVDPGAGGARLRDIAERLQPALAVGDTEIPEGIPRAAFADLAEQRPGTAPSGTAPGPEDTADILFTTGTTGRAKGVVLSHRAIAASTRHINAFVGTGPGAIEALPLPLSHSFGLGRMRCVLTAGAALVPVNGLVNAANFFEAVRVHRATGFASVPSGIAILLTDGGESLASLADRLQYVEIGSAPMPLEQKRRLMRLLPRTRICMHYGLTEASRSAFLSFHDDAGALESIGRPSDGVAIRIVLESGEEAPAGVEGQLEVRGEHLMSGYWRDPELTTRSLRGGWLRTGDLGRRDAGGYFWLGGRESDVINVGGRKVAPQEIETILMRHPAIAECACAGVADPQGLSGQMVCVWLVARPGAERPRFPELAKMLRAELEPYKIPRRFAWVAELPRSSSGKILRGRLASAGTGAA